MPFQRGRAMRNAFSPLAVLGRYLLDDSPTAHAPLGFTLLPANSMNVDQLNALNTSPVQLLIYDVVAAF